MLSGLGREDAIESQSSDSEVPLCRSSEVCKEEILNKGERPDEGGARDTGMDIRMGSLMALEFCDWAL